jgi:hypothetical protein
MNGSCCESIIVLAQLAFRDSKGHGQAELRRMLLKANRR